MNTSCCEPGTSGAVRRPRLDVIETPEAYLLETDLPGVASDAVDLQFEKGVLTISATPGADNDDESRTVLRRETSRDSFLRRVRIGDGVDIDGVDATLTNGVLTVTLPKSEAQRPRQIKVTGGK